MANTSSTDPSIREQINYLEQRLNALANSMRLKPARMRVDAAYMIPFRDQKKVDDSKDIVVTPLVGSEAVKQVIYGLTSIYIDQGKQNPRETLRVPGVVGLPEDWLTEIEEINALKQAIQDAVGEIKDQYQRMKIWGSVKYLSALQTMRQHMILTDEPAKIRLYWDTAPSIRKKTAADWITYYTTHLHKLHGYVPMLEELLEGDTSRNYVSALTKLSKEDSELFIAEFRPGKPHIRARVVLFDQKKAIFRAISTPICYPIENSVPLITALTNWEAGKHTARDNTRVLIESEPFFLGLYLYHYKKPAK
ncbi:DNA replication terminus site-binding protein [Pseudomonas tritici]|uniref:DNA replication terminus site-binding protein n=1 Tax=Pseudomonas tritici TaxID=2745518 RepID=UPI00387B915E